MTNASFDLEQASVRRGYFIGDYQGLAAVGNDFDAFFAATNGTDPGDIFFRDPPAVQPNAASINGSARLLVSVANAMETMTPAAQGQSFATSPTSSTGTGVSVSPPAAPMAASAGQVIGSAISQPSPAVAMKALDLVFAGEGEDSLSDGLHLAVIGS